MHGAFTRTGDLPAGTRRAHWRVREVASMSTYNALRQGLRSAIPAVALSLLFTAHCGGQAFGTDVGDAGGRGDDDAGGSRDSGSDAGQCLTCPGPAPQSPNYECADGTTGGPVCDRLA